MARYSKRRRMARDQQRRTGSAWVPQPERLSRTERRMAAFNERKALEAQQELAQDQPAGRSRKLRDKEGKNAG